MAKKLTDSELKTLKEKASALLANDRQKLVCRYPFIGNVAMKLDVVPVRDVRCRTACTDGNTVYFDIAFLSELTEDQRLFVFGHEVWHNVMLHFARLQTRDPMLFNLATDMEVNQILQKDGFKAPANLIFPSTYNLPNDKSAEEYYEMLLKQAEKEAKKNGKSQQQSGDGDGDGDGNGDGDGDSTKGKKSKAKSKNGNGSGNANGKLSGQFDKHSYDNEAEEDANGTTTDKYGEVGTDNDFKPSVSGDAAEKMREAAISAAQQVERTQGNVPGHIASIIEKLKKPEIKWEEMLAQFVTRCMNGEKRQWSPPNRRHVWHDTYLQSRRGEKLNVVVAVDTSGSCVQDLPKFFGEVMSLVKSFGRYNLTLIQTDYAVSSVDEFDDSGNPFPEDATDIEWHGGGGTSFTPAFEYLEDNGIRPDCFIYFTDGYGDVNIMQPDFPVMWILTKDGTEDFCDWGEKVKFKNDSYSN